MLASDFELSPEDWGFDSFCDVSELTAEDWGFDSFADVSELTAEDSGAEDVGCWGLSWEVVSWAEPSEEASSAAVPLTVLVAEPAELSWAGLFPEHPAKPDTAMIAAINSAILFFTLDHTFHFCISE